MESLNLKDNLKYQDLVYFGYDHSLEDGSEARKNEQEFINDLRERFPDASFKDAYDSIKGYRQEVYLPEGNSDSYYTWLIAFGWYEFSLTMGIMMRSPDRKDDIEKYIKLAKVEYPQNFKPDGDDDQKAN